ncbi:hypothetical protein PHLGIDRAFT_199802 [Phlebiopsis gigantea 11061_1 CR5-6]|uniref:Uncharacterized protein n=1 Tax=Phlebiopsis gigantea (strain 11061_1 CR5-6) TaxID=745531 RepID=A0A0C3S6X8_PHLG1|nr:hypothetical protein PHLGIDRAFT_199802 [Phlebiopsis gigantea 11061_1 CR5-6]
MHSLPSPTPPTSSAPPRLHRSPPAATGPSAAARRRSDSASLHVHKLSVTAFVLVSPRKCCINIMEDSMSSPSPSSPCSSMTTGISSDVLYQHRGGLTV